MDSLPKLFKAIFPDSAIAKRFKCGRTVAHKIASGILGNTSLEEVVSELRNSSFSIILDETTDISTKKALVLLARQTDQKTFKVRDKFLGLFEIEKSDADGIFRAVLKYFEKYGIPLKNLIGVATDNANVMIGKASSFKSKMKDICPDIFFLGCICHSLHLCASKACLKLLNNIEKLCRDIYAYFPHSSERIHELAEFQAFFESKPHKIFRPCQTRWLSLSMVVERILEQWDALQHFFISQHIEEGMKDNTRNISEEMGNLKNKIYFYFLSYILKIVNSMNLEFQSEQIRIHKVLKIIEIQFKTILHNFLKKEYLERLENLNELDLNRNDIFLPLKDIYIGMKAENELLNTNCNVEEIKNNILNFYITLSKEISNRFDFNNEKLKILEYIDPDVAQNLQTSEICSILTKFSNILKILNLDEETVCFEWRQLLNCTSVSRNLPIEQYWYEISKIKNACDVPMVENLCKFVSSLFSLLHSSATAERAFSRLKRIKTESRNRLDLKTINFFMAAGELIKNCNSSHEWNPNQELLKKMKAKSYKEE